jgi:predicted MPP superfamily phosphohydrolase
MRTALQAASLIVAEDPDVVVIAGDVVNYWKRGCLSQVARLFRELRGFRGRMLAVPGNHDYFGGDAERLRPVLEEAGVAYLRNEVWRSGGIEWIGVDSALARKADPFGAVLKADPARPMVLVWHEPDAVRVAPRGIDLMLSGHSHGGQFRTPWGWAPARSKLGHRYLDGFYPWAPVPLYVTRGVGVTGPPTRLFCRPEVSILTLGPAAGRGPESRHEA